MILSLLAISLQGSAQDISRPEVIQEIVVVENGDAKELYGRAKLWIARSFNSAKDVIQLDNPDDGIIILKGVIPYDAPAFNPGTNFTGSFHFMLTLEFKDGRYKYMFENLRHMAYKSSYSGGLLTNEKPECGGMFMTIKAWRTITFTGYEMINQTIDSMTDSMKNSSKDKDW
jgi:hypothetical protein